MSNVVHSCGHPAWHRPLASATRPQLMLRNSLTDTKEVFTPSEGNIVRMYVCGPTVYSVSHMGHARTFLSFDIMRRVLEKYFRFNVLYQMNITDIDDKIIVTARRNELVKRYLASEECSREDGKYSAELVHSLIAANGEELSGKLNKLKENVPAETSREFAEYDTAIKQLELKIEQLEVVRREVDAAPSSQAAVIAKDLLAIHLDKEQGHLVDDKSVFESHSRYYENEFLVDCKNLGIRLPDVLTRVTEYVDEIVTFIEQIQANGFAYESNGSVYFDTQKFKQTGEHEYPKLVPHAGSGATDAEIAEGEGALSGGDIKRHRNDFALWKKSKSGEPKWNSPWGEGRPGWHIECSVMATSVHGKLLDAHLGGVDLKFPHHDNEIAQTEAHYDSAQWVNYFLHAGHLHIKGLKMAKSLKNFITIRQALEKYSAKQIRLMFLLQQWDKPVNFSDQTMNEAREKESRFNSFFARIAAAERSFPVHSSVQKWDATDFKLADAILAAQEKAHSAMCDNMDTPTVLEQLELVVGTVNQYLIEQGQLKYPLLVRARDFVHGMLSVFGVVSDGGDVDGSSDNKESDTTAIVNALISVRDRIRELASASKSADLLTLSDELRDSVFVDLGIKVVDGSKKAESWSFASPADLRREIQVREDEKREREAGKLSNKLSILQKEFQRLEKFAGSLSDRDILFSEFTQFDEEGLPAEVSASKRKALKKDLEKLAKDRSDFVNKGGPSFLAALENEIKEIEAKLAERSL